MNCFPHFENPEFSFKEYKNIIDFFLEHKKGNDSYINYIIYINFIKFIKFFIESLLDTTIDKENMCLLCCANTNNTKINPCGHVCCDECLRQYLTTKNTCFMCNGKIESHEPYTFK